jgi:hypothetical protein
MYEGKDPLKTVDQYCYTFLDTNQAKVWSRPKKNKFDSVFLRKSNLKESS